MCEQSYDWDKKNAKPQLVFRGCFHQAFRLIPPCWMMLEYESPYETLSSNRRPEICLALYSISEVYFPVWVKLFGMIRLPIQCLMNM